MIVIASLLLCSATCAWTFQLTYLDAFHTLHKQDWRKGTKFAHRSKPLCSIISQSDNPTSNTNTLPLSPPEHINNLKIGDKVDAFRRKYVRIERNATSDAQYQEVISNFTIERVSYLPDAFVLRKLDIFSVQYSFIK